MIHCKYHCLIVLMCHVKFGWSEVCSSIVEDITVNQCNPGQRSSNTLLESTNAELTSRKACSHFIDNVSYRVVHTDHGIISYHIVLPPASCQYTRYMFKLVASNASLCSHIDEISSGRVRSDAIRSDYADEMSVKNVKVALRSDAGDAGSCSDDLDLTFEYVSTQCYQLVVQPFISHDSQIQLYSNWHSIETKYKPIHPHLFVPQFDWRHDQLANSVTVRLIIHSILTMRPLASCIEIMSGVDAAGQHACYESGSRMSQCLVWFGHTDEHSALHRCDKDRDSESGGVSTCTSATENELECSIENVSVGNYCVVMKFLDERCQGSESACSWHKMFVVNNRSVLPPSFSSLFPPPPAPYTTMSTSLLILLAALTLLGVSALLLLRVCAGHNLGMRRYKHLMLPMSLARSPLTEVSQEERPVLLLYARDCEPMAKALADFKTLLQRTGKCQVLDFWDVDHFNSVARDPIAWINNHLTNDKMTIIIVNTQVAQLLLQNQIPLDKHNSSPLLPELSPSNLSAQSKNSNVNNGTFNSFNASERFSVSMNGMSHVGQRESNIELDDPGPPVCGRFSPSRTHDTVSVLSKRLEVRGCSGSADDQCTPLLGDVPTCQSTIVTSQSSNFKVNVRYKHGKCFDNLFVVALKSLAQHCAANPSRKLAERVYIVGFDSDVQSLCSSYLLPMTLTRFILPQHTENLLYHIHSLSPLSKRFTLDSSDDFLKLKLSIDLLLKFRRSQPLYLLDLLVNAV